MQVEGYIYTNGNKIKVVNEYDEKNINEHGLMAFVKEISRIEEKTEIQILEEKSQELELRIEDLEGNLSISDVRKINS